MLKQRLITAIILAPLAIWGVFGLALPDFMVMLDLVILVAAWEWANLSGLKSQFKRFSYVAGMGVVVTLMHLNYSLLPVQALLILAVLFWVLALYWVARYPSSEVWRASQIRILIGFFVLLPCWIAFVQLKLRVDGNAMILLLFLLVWGADVGAYFAGKRWGRNKLAVHVSPGKTREGLWGGMLICILIAVLAALMMQLTLVQSVLLMLLAFVCGLISVLGDLFESMLKRYRGIKDSSNLLPGHGGVLDRIDSLTAAAPLFVLGLTFLIKV